MILEKMLSARKVPMIPDFQTKEEWEALREQYKEILCREEYGMPVPAPESLSFEEGPIMDDDFASGYGIRYTVTAHTKVAGKEFSFPFHVILPTTGKAPYPFFVHNDFDPGEPTRFCPIEEIVQQGVAVLRVHYKDITTDDDDFTNGLAGCLYPDGDGINRAPDSPGKIQMWAWGSMRLMDYAMQCPVLDHKNGAVIGHSRLGKTALVTGMLDERFRYVIGNDSGCSGDAITRGKSGERIYHILAAHRWFCPNYKKYCNKHDDLPFDQHMLLATIAPRVLIIGSAQMDVWADPLSQYLSICAAAPVWKRLGAGEFPHADRRPEIGDRFGDDNLYFHMRFGQHYLGRTDWNIYIDIIKKKMESDA
ncbi:MAG: hypothetical protein IKA76_00760 [Clostridia bacterium]|nr:hypothetical protein [Clostridia bacterium]